MYIFISFHSYSNNTIITSLNKSVERQFTHLIHLFIQNSYKIHRNLTCDYMVLCKSMVP